MVDRAASKAGLKVKADDADADIVVLVLGETSLAVHHDGAVALGPKSVSLVAVQAFTHSYGQNQRHVWLETNTEKQEDKVVTVDVPTSSRLLLPGHYHLFLLSEAGVPSVSVHCVVVRADDGEGSSRLWAIVLMSIGGVIAVAGVSVWVYRFGRGRRGWLGASGRTGRILSVALSRVSETGEGGSDELGDRGLLLEGAVGPA